MTDYHRRLLKSKGHSVERNRDLTVPFRLSCPREGSIPAGGAGLNPGAATPWQTKPPRGKDLILPLSSLTWDLGVGYGLNTVSSQTHTLKLTPSMMVLGDGALGRSLGHEGGTSSMGLTPRPREGPGWVGTESGSQHRVSSATSCFSNKL